MPIDYSKYPKNWKSEIRPIVLLRAKNCCEECGIENYSVGYRDSTGKFIKCHNWLYKESMYTPEGFKVIKIVLTIAHMDHDVTNNDYANLKALCQKCHLGYDKEHHISNAKGTIKNKKGLQSLF